MRVPSRPWSSRSSERLKSLRTRTRSAAATACRSSSAERRRERVGGELPEAWAELRAQEALLARGRGVEHEDERRLLRATSKAEGSRRLMGQEDVEAFVGKLARMPPGLDGVGQRLRQGRFARGRGGRRLRPPFDSPTDPFSGASTVTSWPRAASPAAEAAARRADPACRSGNHWSIATRMRTASRPASRRRGRAGAPSSPPKCSAPRARAGGRPPPARRPRAPTRSRRRTASGPSARVTSGSIPRAPGLRSRRRPCRRRGTRRP